MDILERFRKDVIDSILSSTELTRKEVNGFLENPPKEVDADLAFPCFALAKKLKKAPQVIAADISINMKIKGLVKKFDVSGAYINFYSDWDKMGSLLLKEVETKGDGYGSGKSKEKVMVEFAHPNTHKAFHIGHVRNIAFGESLSRILSFSGKKVYRVNYQGDIGPHVAKCVWGLQNLGLKEPSEGKGVWLGEVYSKASKKIKGNEILENEVREVNKKLYSGDKKLTKILKDTRKWSLDYFNEVYKDFGVKFDRFYFESEVESNGIKLAKQLLKKKVAKKSEGAIVMDLEKDKLGVYVLLTKDETPLYSIKDFVLADLQNKEYNPDKIVHVVGTEQRLHFRQLFKSLEKVNSKVAKKEYHLSYELVNLKSGKMSSREGDVITYDKLKSEVLKRAVKETKKHSSSKDIAELITLGGIKYDMLKQSPEKVITFDWDQALSFDGNSAPYLQYTHARANSLLNKHKGKICKIDSSELNDRKELALLKKILLFPEAVQISARDMRPHYITNYVFELAIMFNEFYQNVPILKSKERDSRLALVRATKQVIKNGLNLLGIDAPDKM